MDGSWRVTLYLDQLPASCSIADEAWMGKENSDGTLVLPFITVSDLVAHPFLLLSLAFLCGIREAIILSSDDKLAPDNGEDGL